MIKRYAEGVCDLEIGENLMYCEKAAFFDAQVKAGWASDSYGEDELKKLDLLFNETGIAATKGNLEKLTAIANNVKDYMNKEGIDFEEEEPCR